MKKLAIGLYVAVTVALMVWGFYQAIYVAPDDAMQGEISRIFYYHVPSAMVAFLFFAISLCRLHRLSRLAPQPARAGRRPPTPGRSPALKSASSSAPSSSPPARSGAAAPGASGGLGMRASPPRWSSGSSTSATCFCAASPPARRCRRSPPCSASSALSMCPSSTCPIAGGARSTPRPSSAADPTPASKTPPCSTPSDGTCWPGSAGACSSSVLRYRVERQHQKIAAAEAQEALTTPDHRRRTMIKIQGEAMDASSNSRSPVHRRRLHRHLDPPTRLPRLARLQMAR